MIPELGEIDRRASIADMAPTQAELLDFDFAEVDGRALPEIETPGGAAPPDRDARLGRGRHERPRRIPG